MRDLTPETTSAPPLLVIPSSLCRPCEPQASAVGRWNLPLGWPNSQKSVLKSLKAVMLFWWHSRCQTDSAPAHYLLTFSIAGGVWGCNAVEKKNKKIEWPQFFLTSTRITQNKTLLTVLLLGLLSAHLTWFHSYWPTWKWTRIKEQFHRVCLRPVWGRKSAKSSSWNSLPQLQLQRSRSVANPVQAGNIAPW